MFQKSLITLELYLVFRNVYIIHPNTLNTDQWTPEVYVNHFLETTGSERVDF